MVQSVLPHADHALPACTRSRSGSTCAKSESKSHAGIPVSHVADAFKGCLALVIVSGRGVRLWKVTGTFGNIRVAFRRPRFPIFVLHHRGMWDVVGGPNMNRHEAVEGCPHGINGCTRALGFEVSAARRAFVSTFMEFSRDCSDCIVMDQQALIPGVRRNIVGNSFHARHQ